MGIDMETEKKKLKVYCETSFWSWLVSRPSTMITLPKTVSVVVSAGYECPRILTPKDALEVNYD